MSIKYKLGWLKDYPDFRDFSPEHNHLTQKQKLDGNELTVKQMLRATGIKPLTAKKTKVPSNNDLRAWCSPIEDQGQIGSCTANAGAALLEYFERRSFGKHLDASRLFLYKTTRKLSGLEGDTGAYLRTTMAAMRLFGILPEEFWRYKEEDFDIEPPAFCYAYAQNFQAISFYRLDINGIDGSDLLHRIKDFLNHGLPSMFGFSVFESINQASQSGEIPFPGINERMTGGHAVVAVGYDDNKKVTNWSGVSTTGAFLIRNSWGVDWGDQGYGWLPYDYVLYAIATDWWSLLKSEWVDTGQFK